MGRGRLCLTCQECASELWSLALVMNGGEVLGVVVSPIVLSWSPENAKLSLSLPATQPVKTQVHGLESLGNNGVVDDAIGSGVVGLDGGLALRPTHFDERLSERNHCAGTLVECAEFSFRS